MQAGGVSVDAQFNYAWALVRSKYTDDKVKGIKLLLDLLERKNGVEELN